MRLKYYLRGLGFGIIFAVVIMMIGIHNHDTSLSDSQIIERAAALGMVPSTENNTEALHTEALDNEETGTENTENTESTENQEEINDSEDLQNNTEPASTENSLAEDTSTITTFTITVSNGDTCRMVAERLKAAGLIDDAENFRIYMGQKGVDHHIKNGDHVIPLGSSYDDIINLLTQ